MNTEKFPRFGPAHFTFLLRTSLCVHFLLSITVLLGTGAVALGLPIKNVQIPIALLLIGVTVMLCLANRGPVRLIASAAGLIGFAAAFLFFLRQPLFGHEFVSTYQDAWAYSAGGIFFYDHPRGLVQGETIALVFASTLSAGRFATMSLLALINAWFHWGVCEAPLFFAFIVLSSAAAGMLVFARRNGTSRAQSVLAALFFAGTSWTSEMLAIGHWDQLLFVSLLPGAMVRLQLTLGSRKLSKGGLFLTTITLAALVYAYAEGAAIVCIPFLAWTVAMGRRRLPRLVLVALFSLILLAPILPHLLVYLPSQIAAAGRQIAQGSFPGLIDWRFPAAIFDLGQGPLDRLGIALAGLLLLTMLLGWRNWIRNRSAFILFLAGCIPLLIWQGSIARYDYGVYKIVTIAWPVSLLAVFGGLQTTFRNRLIRLLCTCVLLTSVYAKQVADYPAAGWRIRVKTSHYRELRAIAPVAGNRIVTVRTQYAFNQLWMCLLARDAKIVVPRPVSYLNDPFIERNQFRSPDQPALQLTDYPAPDPIWHNSLFWLSPSRE